MQEAQAASGLNHPHIVTIYDIGQADGDWFIAMEYVPGRPLARLIGHKGVPLRDAVRYAIQIADALACAHAAGHRPPRPEAGQRHGDAERRHETGGLRPRESRRGAGVE